MFNLYFYRQLCIGFQQGTKFLNNATDLRTPIVLLLYNEVIKKLAYVHTGSLPGFCSSPFYVISSGVSVRVRDPHESPDSPGQTPVPPDNPPRLGRGQRQIEYECRQTDRPDRETRRKDETIICSASTLIKNMSRFIYKHKTIYPSHSPVAECRPQLCLGGCGYFEGLSGGPLNTCLMPPLPSYSTSITGERGKKRKKKKNHTRM